MTSPLSTVDRILGIVATAVLLTNIALFVALLAGCGGGVSTPSVLLTVEAPDPIADVALLRVTVTSNQQVSLPVEDKIDPPAAIPPARSIRLRMPPAAGAVRIDTEALSASGEVLARGSVEAVGAAATVSLLHLPVPVANDGGALDIAFPNAPTDAASVDCSTSRPSCRAHLGAGCSSPGVYLVGAKKVYCDGGWLLAYSNANNWADANASDVQPSQIAGHAAFRWYDSTWGLLREASPTRLGRARGSGEPLRPEDVGGEDVRALYLGGLTDVRIDFIRGTDGAVRSGWCSTTALPWDFTAGRGSTCRDASSGALLCLSGKDTCDGSSWNSGWSQSLTLGNAAWDYAYQSAPNHLTTDSDHAGPQLGIMVAGFEESAHVNNATDGDFQVRLWLREP